MSHSGVIKFRGSLSLRRAPSLLTGATKPHTIPEPPVLRFDHCITLPCEGLLVGKKLVAAVDSIGCDHTYLFLWVPYAAFLNDVLSCL